MRTILLFALTLATSEGAIRTVCASGCNFSNLQTALNSAVRGDIVELRAGEVFEGAFQLPYKTGNGYITIRSSRWRELPPPGTRVTAADAVLMATLQPPSASSPALAAGPEEQFPSSVSLSTDTINFGGSHGFVNGDPLACWNDDGSIPIVENRIYYARDVAGNTLRLAATPGGPVVDLQTPVTATRFRCTLVRPPSHWRIQGIEIRKKPGQVTEFNLVQIGSGSETAREGIVHHIEFDRVYIHGIPEENGPRICLALNSANTSVTDSRIEHCNKEGEESKAIAGWQMPGPILVRNNYIAAGSINLLIGGDFVRVEGLTNGDNGGIRIEGNHFTRPFWTKYSAGSGGATVPSGACSEYTRYLNTSTGQWYLCQGGSWTLGPTCAEGEYYRRTNVTQTCPGGACWKCSSGLFTPSTVFRGTGYNTKNLFELKSATNVVVAGNVFENNWVNSDQSGVAVWVISQVGQGNANGWVRGENIRFERNVIRNSSQGLRVAAEGNTTFGIRNNYIQVQDNLLYWIGATQFPSINSNDSRPLSFAGHCNDCLFDHNTVVSGTTGGTGLAFDTNPLIRFRFANSISYNNQYGLLYDSGLPCTSFLPSPAIIQNSILVNPDNSSWTNTNCASNLRGIPNNTPLFQGGGDYRLLPTSPYSASCTTGCVFAGTDGKDIGADVELVDAATSGATAGLAVPSRFQLRVDVGSQHAILRYVAPDPAACAIRLYTNPGRSTLHADTLTAGTQSDNRSGSLADGLRREFALGGVAPLTAGTVYHGVVDCGGRRTPFRFRTAEALGTTEQQFRTVQAYPAQYAANALFTSPTSLGASNRHTIPVPSGSLVYVRIGDQAPTVLAGR